MNAEDKRVLRLQLQEDHIGRALAESEKAGELKAAPSYGKPLGFGDGYDETPPELRMPFKILKDAGVVPPEVELMRQISAVQAELDAAPDEPTAAALRSRLNDMRQALALRLERLRASGSL
jgi:hypothetical protein